MTLHKTRDLSIKQRTMNANALHSHLSEFGIVAAKGIGRIDELLERVEEDMTLPGAAKTSVRILAKQIEELNKALGELETEIADFHSRSDMSRLLVEVPGINKLGATVIVASIPDARVFPRGRDFAAWLGLTPRQNSSGGKPSLGAITKQGNRYIRK